MNNVTEFPNTRKMRWISSTVATILLLYTNMAGGVSLSKPGCPDTCGNNVTIPYPFGIGPECSANEYFRVVCNNTKPFLEYSSLEALEFSLDKKVVRLLQGVFPLNCSTNTVILVGPIISHTDSPFTYSSLYNRLVVVGCGNEVRVLDQGSTRPSFGGCSPICGSITPSCNGINCCQTTVPSQFAEPEVFYNTTGNGRAGEVCGYTFLSDQRWIERDYIGYLDRYLNRTNKTTFNPLQLLLKVVPMVLDWRFNVSNDTTTTPQGVKCVNESVFSAASLFDDARNSINTTRCYCDYGYEGNPYLPGGGCHDVDECSNPALNNCALGQYCINTVGHFTCKDPNDTTNQMKSTVIGVSSGSGAMVLLGWAWIFYKVTRKRIKGNRKKKFFKGNGGLLLEQKLSSNDGGVERITLFSSKELALATDRYNENRILGRGGQGTVYKGMLPDGRIVAVKKSKKMDQGDIEVFINEVVILSQIRHRNVVRVLGCCLETEVPLLVYEFVPNGTLFEHIHGLDNEFPLTWKMRARIAAEVAGALSYLHYAALAPIYHRDIKSTNILLDEKYRAKVSDFGTSRSVDIDQTHVTTRVMGTLGYLDPEYFQTNQFTEKSDVYSFGVVVVELLTGEKAISAERAEVGRSLAAHFLYSMEENRLVDILDPKVLKEGRPEEIAAIAKLAGRCLHLNGKNRPTMKEVAAELEGIRMIEEGSILQSQHTNPEFHNIEFSSIFECTTFSSTTAESSNSPLLLGNSLTN